jgi:hypothetical protein
MRGVPDATGDLQVFWDDDCIKLFWYLVDLVFGLNIKSTRIGKPLLFWLDNRNAVHTLARHGD